MSKRGINEMSSFITSFFKYRIIKRASVSLLLKLALSTLFSSKNAILLICLLPSLFEIY